MKIVIDIGTSAADVPAVLSAMNGPGMELVGQDKSHVGCRVVGIVEEKYEALLPYIAPAVPVASVREPSRRPGLVPGVNVDRITPAGGTRAAEKARELGYTRPEQLMTVQYALMRHLRGEEDGAEKSALHGGIDLTSWRVILAAAIVSSRS